MEELKKYIPIYLRICRSIALYVTFLLISALAFLCTGKNAAAGTGLTALIFHSTTRVFSETDRHTRDLAYLYRESYDVHARSVRDILRCILTSRELQLELGILLLLPVLLPFEAGYGHVAALLFHNAVLPRLVKKLLLMLLVLPLLFGFWLLARYYAFLWWAYDKNERETSLGRALVLKLLGITAIYVVGGVALVFFLPVAVSVYYITIALIKVRWWLPLLIVGGTLLFWWSLRFQRAFFIRRKFLKKLKRLSAACGAELSPVKRPYRSLVWMKNEISFTIRHGQKTYTCKLFCTLKRHTPLYFSEKGIVECLHSLRFRRVEYFRYTTQFDFSFTGEGTKALIVTPVPKELYAGTTSFYRLIDTGEAVGDYKIFTATGFLGALERDVVDR